MIVELNEYNFKENIKNGLKLVIFSTTWCSYCQKEQEVLKELSDIWIGKVDGDKNLSLLKEYGIMGFPTFLVFKNGELQTKFSGYKNKFELMNMISKYI